MRTSQCCRAALAAAATLGLLALAPGCGDDGGLERRYKVTGTVSYKGAPVAKGRINFVPVDASKLGATGPIEDGQYTLTTFDPDDGALPGKYKVTVDTREADASVVKAATEKFAKKNKMKGEYSQVPQDVMAQALKKSKGTVPGKYQITETSDIEVEVKPASNTIPIDLKD